MRSVHIRVEEKMTLTAGRDGGLQNLDVHGLLTLRISDEKFGRIKLGVANNDDKGAQLQVSVSVVEYVKFIYTNWPSIFCTWFWQLCICIQSRLGMRIFPVSINLSVLLQDFSQFPDFCSNLFLCLVWMLYEERNGLLLKITPE